MAVAGFCTWAYGVYLVLSGLTGKGMVIAGTGAIVLLLLAWARGVSWLPDGGGP